MVHQQQLAAEAEAAVAAAAGGEEAPAGGLGEGRSKRVGKARLVYVNGQPVLRENLYDLEDGEPSVFDKELGKGAMRGRQG